ncbi:CHAT domain-containing protein, partial [Pseudomonas helleri]
VQLVDVASKDEIIEVLRSFKGIMVIFDCHGGHGGEKDSAWLHIGGENVDVWHIYQNTRVPPIVILAACSTHPVEGSHASVANGFLESGACSVLGTFAPINSDHAATFVIRLLTRVAVYLPIALKSRPYTWREIISGLFRMSYTRDVLTYLRDDKKLLSQNQYASIHIKTNILVNSLEDRGWFDKFKLLIGEELKIDRCAINDLFLQYFQFVETMLMVQLGRPENIVIIAD